MNIQNLLGIASSIIDFTIVGYIVYRILLWSSSSKAQSLLRGLLPLIGVYFIGKLLQLNTVSWLLEGFIPILALAVIIIFQPELRKFLEEIGSTSVILRQVEPKMGLKTVIIQHLLKTVDILTKEKLGALIVIEQNDLLDSYMESGIEINANISSELISSIFWKNTPTHDGALIIRDSKVKAVGCLLPLSSASQRRKGTRHLAALGLSELSDAIIMVISEETGHISIAKNNILSEKLSKKDLEAYLFSIYKKEKQFND